MKLKVGLFCLGSFLVGIFITAIYFDSKIKVATKRTDSDVERDCLVVSSNIKQQVWNAECSNLGAKPLCNLGGSKFFELETMEQEKFNTCLVTLMKENN